MDDVFIRIQGVQHYLWRGVDQPGCARRPDRGPTRRQGAERRTPARPLFEQQAENADKPIRCEVSVASATAFLRAA
jgi:hypothetical protein